MPIAEWRMHPCIAKAIGRALGVLLLLVGSLAALKSVPPASHGILPVDLRLLAALVVAPFVFTVVSMSSGIIAGALGTLLVLSESGVLSGNELLLSFELLLLVVVASKRGITGEALYDVGRTGRVRPYTLTSAIAVAGLILWLRQQTSGYLLVYAAAAANAAYVWSCSLGIAGSLVLGALSGIPVVGTAVASLCSSMPARIDCGSGFCLGSLVALRRPASRPRMYDETLGLHCVSGRWRVPSRGPLRMLIVGGGWLPRPAGSIYVELHPGESSLSEFESVLSQASSIARAGGVGVIKLGVSGERSLVEGMLSAIGSYASETGTPVVLNACSVSSPGLVYHAVRSFETSPAPLIVKVCSEPSHGLSSLFTGPRAARVACRVRDPELIVWVARSVLGLVDASPSQIDAIASLLARGYCLSSNICGWPGLFVPGRCGAE